MNNNAKTKWLGFSACIIAGIIPELSSSIISQVSPAARVEFHTTPSAMQMPLSISKLLFASFVLAAGIFGDVYGRKKILLIGTAGLLLASLVCCFAPSLGFFTVGRALDGIFATMVSSMSLAMLVMAFPIGSQPLLIGYYLSFLGIASLAGPYVAAKLVQSFGWRSAFLFESGTALLALITIKSFIPSIQTATVKKRIDFLGAIICAAGLLLFSFGIIQSNVHGWSDHLTWGSILAGSALLVFFVWWEAYHPQPLMDLSLFKNKRLSIAIVTGMIVSFIGAGLYLPLLAFFRIFWKSTPTDAALQVMPLALSSAVASAIAGKFVKQGRERYLMAVGLVTAAFGAFGLSTINVTSPYWFLAFSMILIGAGNAFAITPRTAVILNAIPADSAGAASGLSTASSKLGSALGTPILSTVFLAFAKKDYIEQMQPLGLSFEQLKKVTLSWREAAQNAALHDVPQNVMSAELVRQIEAGFRHAFSKALGYTELIAAALCVLTAALVWFGLKTNRASSNLSP